MVARHPLYRLTSGYEDKFSTLKKYQFHLKYWRQHHGNEIELRVKNYKDKISGQFMLYCKVICFFCWKKSVNSDKAQFGKAFPSTDQHTVSFNAFLSYLAKKNDLKSMEWESWKFLKSCLYKRLPISPKFDQLSAERKLTVRVIF